MSNLDSHVGKFIEHAVDLCISGKTDEVKADKIDLDPIEAERKFPSYYIEGFILNFDEKQRYSESDEEAGVKQNSDKPAIKTESNNNETAAKELHLEAEQHEQLQSLNSDGDNKTERKTAGLAVPYELRSKYTTPMTPAQVKKLFSDAGFEVIDKTSKGGCIWIIANPEDDDEINKLAVKSGRWFRLAQNGGRSTNYRRAYFWMPRKKSGRR